MATKLVETRNRHEPKPAKWRSVDPTKRTDATTVNTCEWKRQKGNADHDDASECGRISCVPGIGTTPGLRRIRRTALRHGGHDPEKQNHGLGWIGIGIQLPHPIQLENCRRQANHLCNRVLQCRTDRRLRVPQERALNRESKDKAQRDASVLVPLMRCKKIRSTPERCHPVIRGHAAMTNPR